MLQRKIKIGIVPIKRSFLSLDNAIAQKQRILDQLAQITPAEVEIRDINAMVTHGVLWDNYEDMKRVVDGMQAWRPDALFVPHCDFGTEEAVGRIGKALGVPVLLWGERDPAPEAGKPRPTDTQCGLFASSKALQRHGVPFSYIVNSSLQSKSFTQGWQRFCAVASVVKAFRGLRILQVSLRPKAFQSVLFNEAELLSRFGIELVPVSSTRITTDMERYMRENPHQVDEIVAEFATRMDVGETALESRRQLAALRMTLLDIVAEHECGAVALECWSLFSAFMKFKPCVLVGDLSDLGIPVACEADVLGAITSAMLQAASLGRAPVFFADLTQRHPDNDNAELLWHCGPFPYSLREEGAKASLVCGMGNWKLRNGGVTIARFDAVQGEYRLFSGEGALIDGPETTGTYGWLEVDDWNAWEEKIIMGPYIHHMSGAYGDYTRILNEACKYLPGVTPDSMTRFGASL